MLSPKKVKWRKQQKGRMKGRAYSGNEITFGDYALVALTPGFVTSRQIEAARIAISRNTKRGGNMWIKIFPDKSLSRKPAEVRMGAGKGSHDQWVAVVKPGRILFEVGGLAKELSLESLNLAKYKLPIKTKIISKDQVPVAKEEIK